MVNEVIYFLPWFVGFLFLAFGFYFKEYVSGVLGGFVIFLSGVAIIIDPLPLLSSLTNNIIAFSSFGFGAYIWIRGSIEAVKEGGFYG